MPLPPDQVFLRVVGRDQTPGATRTQAVIVDVARPEECARQHARRHLHALSTFDRRRFPTPATSISYSIAAAAGGVAWREKAVAAGYKVSSAWKAASSLGAPPATTANPAEAQ